MTQPDSVFSFADWLAYLRDKAISNTFLGRPVLAGVDWRLKP
jgi:hypothetical protein